MYFEHVMGRQNKNLVLKMERLLKQNLEQAQIVMQIMNEICTLGKT